MKGLAYTLQRHFTRAEAWALVALLASRACSMLNFDAMANPRVLRRASDFVGSACAGNYRTRGSRRARPYPFRSGQRPDGEQDPARDGARRGGPFRLRQ